jgi:hypothetical protein
VSWNPDHSTLAWACGPVGVPPCPSRLCTFLGHRWRTSVELYGPEHVDVIPWAGACERCGVTYGDRALPGDEEGR